MAIVLVENPAKLDNRKTVLNTETITSLDELKEKQDGNFVHLLEASEDNLLNVTNRAEKVFLPSAFVNSIDPEVDAYVYFDLESYPFFQKFKKLVGQQPQSKGVLRFRRVMVEEKSSVMASDLYVLSSVFGNPESVHIKQSKRQPGVIHRIMLVNFGKGIMSHIEYTVANEERIELELSGIKSIVEFNSDDMKPIQPESKTSLPLSYTVNDMMASARKVDEQLINRLQDFLVLIEGGNSV